MSQEEELLPFVSLNSIGQEVRVNERLPISKGILDGKIVEVLRDTGSNVVLVNDNLVCPHRFQKASKFRKWQSGKL